MMSHKKKRKISKVQNNDCVKNAFDHKELSKESVTIEGKRQKITQQIAQKNGEIMDEESIDLQNTSSSQSSPKQRKKKKDKNRALENNQDLKDNLDSEDALNSSRLQLEDLDEEVKVNQFLLHFTKNFPKDKADCLKDISQWKTSIVKWPTLQRIIVDVPTVKFDDQPKSKKLLLEEEEDTDFPPVGDIPEPPAQEPLECLASCIPREEVLKKFDSKSFSPLQSEILTIISQYIDFHYPYSTYDKWDEIRTVYSLHCINHLLKSHRHLKDNEKKMRKLKKLNKDGGDTLFPDQGFTEPKVLILLPFRHSAYKVLQKLIYYFDLEVSQKQRFINEFKSEDEESQNLLKPKDFTKIFEGNIGEDFKIGLKLKKNILTLYSDFYASDIIIASPLGLRFLLESTEGDMMDILSSIEILIMDQTDIFLMQNWEHILLIRDLLNAVPANLQKVIKDLYRIHKWCMDGLSSHYRQTLIFSSTITDPGRVFFKKLTNFAGKMEVLNFSETGSVADITVMAELILQRVKTSPDDTAYSADAQFAHFTTVVLPQIRRKNQSYTLIYVPDYCDYVRLVYYFKEDRGTNVSTINEYMTGEFSKVAKARSLFYSGKRNLMIYTERFHFYKRYKIKGVQHVVFYGLPTYPHFFAEICNLMTESLQSHFAPPMLEQHSITVPFQPSDATKLVGIIGSAKTKEIVNSNKMIHKCEVGM